MTSGPLRGVHVNQANQAAMATIYRARPALIKTLDWGPDWGAVIRATGCQVLVLRKWMDDQANFLPTPEDAADRLWLAMWPDLAKVLANVKDSGALTILETPWNEYGQDRANLPLLARGCRRFCDRAHAAGVKVAVGCFSVGQPDGPDVALFKIGMENADYLALHEYMLPNDTQAPWWIGRWRTFLDTFPVALRRPVIISEFGIDGGLQGRPAEKAGYKAYGMSADEYVNQLEYAEKINDIANHDGLLLGYAVFNCGDYGGGRWQSFEIANAAPLELWLATGPHLAPVDPLPPPSKEPPMAGFNPDPEGYVPEAQKGFAVYQYCLKNKITIWGGEIYETPRCSRTYTNAGVLVYHQGDGVQLLPFTSGQTTNG